MARYLIPPARCTIDLVAREFRRDGELVSLSAKLFDCLAYLIVHHERAIGRDELIAAVWGKADVSDDLLGQLVVKARRTVGDSGNDQGCIRTIPRFGYRWVGALERLPEIPDPPHADAPNESERMVPAEPVVAATIPRAASTQRRRRVPHLLAAAALLLVTALGIGLWWAGSRAPDETTEQAALDRSTVSDALAAVLPMAVKAEGQWGWLRLGMMDLIGEQMRASGLRVVSSDSIVALSRADARDVFLAIQSATGAGNVVVPEATLETQGWRVRLTLRTQGKDAFDVGARDADVVLATHQATALLLARLGRAAPGDKAGFAARVPTQELLSRIKAAVLTDDLATAQRLIDAAPAALLEVPQVRLSLADIDERFGRYEQANVRLERLIGEVGPATDPVFRALILYRHGIVALRRDRIDVALQSFEAGQQLLGAGEVREETGKLLAGRGIAHALQGNYDTAAADFSSARVAYELAGDMYSLAGLESNEGKLELLRHRPLSALGLLDQSIQRMQAIGTYNGLPLAYATKIEAWLLLLSPQEAMAASREFDERFPDAPEVTARAHLEIVQARALAATGQLADARTRLTRLVSDERIRASPSTQARIHALLAQIESAAGAADEAIRLATSAVGVLVLPDDSAERSRAWQALVHSLLSRERVAEAELESKAFSAWAAELGDDGARIEALLGAAQVARARQDDAAAATAFEAALALALTKAVPAYTAGAAVAYANALLDRGEVENATDIASRAFRWADSDFDCALLKVRLYHRLGQVDGWRLALVQARLLAGERPIPPDLLTAPNAARSVMAGP